MYRTPALEIHVWEGICKRKDRHIMTTSSENSVPRTDSLEISDDTGSSQYYHENV